MKALCARPVPGSFLLLLLLLLLFLFLMIFPVHSSAELFMRTGPAAPPPAGHLAFCEKYADECATRFDKEAIVTLDIAIWRTLNRVNRQVNASIRSVPDRTESWDYPTRDAECEDPSLTGDCEDYALLKRRLLHRAGLPLNALLITVVPDRRKTGHAVLTVRTDRGDLVLDNMIEIIGLWESFPYTFLLRQSAFHTGQWVRILRKK